MADISTFAPRMIKIATALDRGKRTTLNRAAMAAKKPIEDSLRKASGGDLKLSGVGKSGAKIGVNFKFEGDAVIMRATGPVQLIENNTSGRVIRSKHARGRQRRGFIGPTRAGQFRGDRRAVLNIPGIGYRRSARHPGTRGKKPWKKGVKAARKPAADELRKLTVNQVKGAL